MTLRADAKERLASTTAGCPWPSAAVYNTTLGGSAPGNHRPSGTTSPDGSTLPAPRVVPTGSSFFSAELLQPVNHQQLLRDHALQLGVLGFQVLQPTVIGHVHAAEAIAPSEEGLLGDVVAFADLPDRLVLPLCLSQDADDLLVRESLLHGVLPDKNHKRTHQPTGYTFRLRSSGLCVKSGIYFNV